MKKQTRVLIKISWEALEWEKSYGIDPHFLKKLALQLKEILENKVQMTLVFGGGNIFRWLAGASQWMDRTAADYMGMLATIMNGIAMQDALESIGVEARLMSALDLPEVWEKYIKRKAESHMKKWRVVICVAGTGNPYFTTDTAWVLRALELGCDMMIKATKVDGVYDKDPKQFSDAVLIEHADYDRVIKHDIRVMDQTGIALAREWKLELRVVNLYKEWAMLRASLGKKEGTIIK